MFSVDNMFTIGLVMCWTSDAKRLVFTVDKPTIVFLAHERFSVTSVYCFKINETPSPFYFWKLLEKKEGCFFLSSHGGSNPVGAFLTFT